MNINFLHAKKYALFGQICGEMFNLPDIKDIDWKKVHVGIEKSNFGEGQLLRII